MLFLKEVNDELQNHKITIPTSYDYSKKSVGLCGQKHYLKRRGRKNMWSETEKLDVEKLNNAELVKLMYHLADEFNARLMINEVDVIEKVLHFENIKNINQ